MSTKICPNCNAEVPAIANLCKHCFHDFHVVPPPKKSPFWTLLFLALGTSFVAAMVFAHIYGQQKVMTNVVDKETKSIVFTTKTPDDVTSERVYWKDVSAIEYLTQTRPLSQQLWVVRTDSKRFLYSESNENLTIDAHRLSETVGKPLIERDVSAEE